MRTLDFSPGPPPISERRMATPAPLKDGESARSEEIPNGDSAATSGAPQITPPVKRRRWPLWILLFLGVVGLGLWLARASIAGRVENALVQRLAERGVYLHYDRRSWSVWHGLHLEGAILRREANGNRPVVEASALTVDISLSELLKTRSVVSRCRMKDATVTLHDDAGAIVFEHVSTQLILRSGEIETPRLDFGHGPLTFALVGKILIAPGAEVQPSPGPFILDLTTVRDVLSVLDFKEGHPPFAIHGTYTLDLRGDAVLGLATRAGAGQGVEWQGVPLRTATAQAELSSAGMNLTSRLQFTAGTADVSVSRKDWDAAPLLVAGTFTDAAGQTDEFSASYDGASETVNVSSLRGKAQLIEFARNFPRWTPVLPANLQIQKFPDLAMTNVSYTFAPKAGSAWKVGAIETRSPADITLLLGGEPLSVAGLEGSAALAENTWKARLKTGRVTWRDLVTRDSRIDATVADAQLKATLGLQLTSGSADLAVSSADWMRAPLQFSGSITDSQGQQDRVSGSYQRDPAVLRIAELSGKANLLEFGTNFPGIVATLPQNIRVRTFPEIAVKSFVYQPGKPSTVDSLRLVSPADITATIQGRPVALDRMTGQVAFDGRAWRLSQMRGRLFNGQWSLDGTYEKGVLRGSRISASALHLAELKAWLGDSPNSIGEAILAFDYRGAVGTDLSQFTGSGTIRMENAPVVKVPLLDQTYALASALVSPVPRRGTAQLNATFSAANGIAKVSQFTAMSDAVKVTAEGTLDLRKREVSARARGNFRGLFGIATGPLSRTLEMQVSGPLDNIRVRPVGLGGILTGTASLVPETAKQASKSVGNLVRDGVALPMRAFDLFKSDTPEKR
jgi:hypothetical protein